MPRRTICLLLTALSGCQVSSLTRPPGRDIDKYVACLNTVYTYPSTVSEGTILGRLAGDVASGRAFTSDQSDAAAWTPGPAPSADTPALLRETERTPFQRFLDCYVGDVDPIDYETRLLRGHMALAMIATYTQSVVAEAPASKKKQDAQTAIGLISAAELGLRADSWSQIQYATAHARFVADKTPGSFQAPDASAPTPTYSDSPMRLVTNITRIDKILSAAAFADGVMVRNIYGLVLSFVGEAAAKVSRDDCAGGGKPGAECPQRSHQEQCL